MKFTHTSNGGCVSPKMQIDQKISTKVLIQSDQILAAPATTGRYRNDENRYLSSPLSLTATMCVCVCVFVFVVLPFCIRP